MLLTITTTHRPATDLGYLLHKNPGKFQVFDLSFGKAHVFYGEATEDRCSASLLLDVDPVGIVRGKGSGEGLLDQYVNERPGGDGAGGVFGLADLAVESVIGEHGEDRGGLSVKYLWKKRTQSRHFLDCNLFMLAVCDDY